MRFGTLKNLLPLGLLVVCLETVVADPIIRISNLPTTYTPGSTITFDVQLVGEGADVLLSAYGVSLIASSATGTAGTDFAFTPAMEGVGNIFPADFPFPAQMPFNPGAPGTTLPTGNDATLSFQDGVILLPPPLPLLPPPAFTLMDGDVHTLASVSLTTLAGAVGDLTLGFDAATELRDDTIPSPLPVMFDTKFPNTMGGFQSGTAITITAVPEPGTVGILLFGSLGLVAWRVRRKTTA